MAGPIERVCVIGAGVMGAAIAAQVANAGVSVLLLDMVPKDGGAADRSALARGAVARMLKTEPAAFMTPEAAKLVTQGNLEDDLEQVGTCQWVVEAIIERLDLKQALYRRLAAVCRPGTVITSNTSTIRLAALTEGMDADVRRRFAITHFFNPPRYMRLLELVTGAETDPALSEALASFIDRRLGKTVVRTHDTPGFIANRIGTYWLQTGVNAAIDQGLSVAEADAVLGRPLGIPKTGVFGLLDLIGLDLMPHISRSMTEALGAEDPFHATTRDLPFLSKMIAEGYTGRKGRGGFYRVNRERGRVRESIGLVTGVYEAHDETNLPSHLARDPRALLASDDRFGTYAWTVMGATLAYAARLVPEVAPDIVAVDAAMRLGFNWKQGPFELLDALGPRSVAERLEREGKYIPPLLRAVGDGTFYKTGNNAAMFFGVDGVYHKVPRADGVLLLGDVKRAGAPLLKNGSAALWDIGDGVACFEFTTKMNTLDAGVFQLLEKSLALVSERFRALVIANDGANFSVGANLGVALFTSNIAAWGELEHAVAEGQRVLKAIKYAPFPVVVAPAGMALGGGCEMMLHADAIVAHAETYAGLVETGVGLVPGWGGNGEMLHRWQTKPGTPRGPMPALSKVFEMVSQARVSTSAADARTMGILRETDGVVMNRDRLLFEARARAVALADGYRAPEKPEFRVAGAAGRAALSIAAAGFARLGIATAHDLVVSDALAEALTGGDRDPLDIVSEDEMLEIERRAFLRLIRTGPTLARIEHMLETGKPLRN